MLIFHAQPPKDATCHQLNPKLPRKQNLCYQCFLKCREACEKKMFFESTKICCKQQPSWFVGKARAYYSPILNRLVNAHVLLFVAAFAFGG